MFAIFFIFYVYYIKKVHKTPANGLLKSFCYSYSYVSIQIFAICSKREMLRRMKLKRKP